MRDGIISGILTTNLIYQTPELLSKPYYINCDMSKYIALIIDTLNHDGSISSILSPEREDPACHSEIQKRRAGITGSSFRYPYMLPDTPYRNFIPAAAYLRQVFMRMKKKILSEIILTILLMLASTVISFAFFQFGNKNIANITVIY